MDTIPGDPVIASSPGITCSLGEIWHTPNEVWDSLYTPEEMWSIPDANKVVTPPVLFVGPTSSRQTQESIAHLQTPNGSPLDQSPQQVPGKPFRLQGAPSPKRVKLDPQQTGFKFKGHRPLKRCRTPVEFCSDGAKARDTVRQRYTQRRDGTPESRYTDKENRAPLIQSPLTGRASLGAFSQKNSETYTKNKNGSPLSQSLLVPSLRNSADCSPLWFKQSSHKRYNDDKCRTPYGQSPHANRRATLSVSPTAHSKSFIRQLFCDQSHTCSPRLPLPMSPLARPDSPFKGRRGLHSAFDSPFTSLFDSPAVSMNCSSRLSPILDHSPSAESPNSSPNSGTSPPLSMDISQSSPTSSGYSTAVDQSPSISGSPDSSSDTESFQSDSPPCMDVSSPATSGRSTTVSPLSYTSPTSSGVSSASSSDVDQSPCSGSSASVFLPSDSDSFGSGSLPPEDVSFEKKVPCLIHKRCLDSGSIGHQCFILIKLKGRKLVYVLMSYLPWMVASFM